MNIGQGRPRPFRPSGHAGSIVNAGPRLQQNPVVRRPKVCPGLPENRRQCHSGQTPRGSLPAVTSGPFGWEPVLCCHRRSTDRVDRRGVVPTQLVVDREELRVGPAVPVRGCGVGQPGGGTDRR